jgi:hypothetical protein
MAGTSYLFPVQVKLGCTALAIQTLVLVFFRALPALFLGVLSGLLPTGLTLSMLTGLAAMLTRLSALTCLTTLLPVFLHIVCHYYPPMDARRSALNDLNPLLLSC